METTGAMPFMISWVSMRLISIHVLTLAASSCEDISSMVIMISDEGDSMERFFCIDGEVESIEAGVEGSGVCLSGDEVKAVVFTARLRTVASMPGRSGVRRSVSSGHESESALRWVITLRSRRRRAEGVARRMWPVGWAMMTPVEMSRRIVS